jgi:hypothetical protein
MEYMNKAFSNNTMCQNTHVYEATMQRRREQEHVRDDLQKRLNQGVLNQGFMDSEDKVKRMRQKQRLEEYHRVMEEEEAFERV